MLFLNVSSVAGSAAEWVSFTVLQLPSGLVATCKFPDCYGLLQGGFWGVSGAVFLHVELLRSLQVI